ncbi:MAG TPA: LptF/LptG family permease [Hyphomicrobiales bacterium]|nr:LptF/LptG family permease [Rhodobiaceae bacterium]HXK54664.1 LptF/LptG family permease [Hyphomicrobiales bacterium]
MPGRYVGGLIRDIARITLGVLAGIEAIYLSDKVITHLLPTTLQNQAGFADLALLVLYATPEILFIGFPVALLIAVYLVLLRRREANEFVVFAGVGYGTGALLALVLVIGLAGQALSLAATGYIEPHALHLFGKTAFETRYKALREGRLAAGKFYVFDKYAVFAPYRRGNDVVDNLFIHARLDANRYRIMIADRATLFGSPEIRNLGLIFENASVHEFHENRTLDPGPAECQKCRNARPAAPFNVLRINHLYGELPAGDGQEFGPRGQRPAELTSLELLTGQDTGGGATREMSARAVRALTCLLAPLIALLAVALTSQATMFIALPAACALILGTGFFGGQAAGLLPPAGMAANLGAVLVLGLAAAAALIWAVLRVQNGCVRPHGVRL